MLPEPLMAVAVVKGPVAEGSFNVVKVWTGMIRPPLMVSLAKGEGDGAISRARLRPRHAGIRAPASRSPLACVSVDRDGSAQGSAQVRSIKSAACGRVALGAVTSF